MTALENAGALASRILETHWDWDRLVQGRGGGNIYQISLICHEKSFLFGLVSCCVVQKYIVYRVLSSMMWAVAVAVTVT